MEAFSIIIVLAIPVAILIRWWVWKGRYRRIQDALSSLEWKQRDLLLDLSALEERIAGGPEAWSKAAGPAEAEAITAAKPREEPAIAKEAAAPSPVITSSPGNPSWQTLFTPVRASVAAGRHTPHRSTF